MDERIIFTVGHSNRGESEFIDLLTGTKVKTLVDIRTFPMSRKFPYFNKEALSGSLGNAGIQYVHLPELGGRRKPAADSRNTGWHNSSFRGYADYMETDHFKIGIEKLERIGDEQLTAYMCSESLWWNCHRRLVSDYLKIRGWKVFHIGSAGKLKEHPLTSPAREVQGNLFYD